MPYEKVGKNEPVCITDEVPFEIPDSWELARLSEVGSFISGYTPKSEALCSTGKIPYFKVSDMNTNGNEKYLSITSAYLKEPCNKYFFQGTIVYPKNGGAVFTNKKRILKQDSVVDLNTGGYYPLSPLYLDYVFMFFSTIDFKQYHKGTALPTLDMERIKNIIFPIPPLSEQIRIIDMFHHIEPFIEQYGKEETTLSELNKKFPKELKKSILQQAVMGKLIPQDPNDEPASILLEKIRAEKDALIKAGKLKKDKHESIIYRRDNSHYEKIDGKEICIDEEIPFEIPNNWTWARLSSIVSILGDGIHGTPTYDQQGTVYFINGNNLCNGQIVIKDDTKRVSKEEACKHKRELSVDTVLTSINGTIGNVAFYSGENIILGKSACYFNLLPGIEKEYVKLLLETDYYLKYASKVATGTTIKNVPLKGMRELLVPIPTCAEQKRIVNAYKTIAPSIAAL